MEEKAARYRKINKQLKERNLRICYRCDKIKSIDEFAKQGKRERKGVCSRCLAIEAGRSPEEYDFNRLNDDLLKQGLRVCRRCKQILKITKFNKGADDSILTVCKRCNKSKRKYGNKGNNYDLF